MDFWEAVLDGLDEMVRQYREGRINSILQYLREFPLAHVIVTCREKDYIVALSLKLPRLIVSPLDDDRVGRLIHVYLPADAAESLWEAIQPRRKHEYYQKRSLLELARNPYLLTLLTWIYHYNGSLPENAAKLFKQLIELRYKHEASRAEPPFDFGEFPHTLGDLAFEMIDQDKGTSADKKWAKAQLGECTDDLIRFGEACSVLVDIGNEVRFYHQLMQEYWFFGNWRGKRNIWGYGIQSGRMV